MKSITRLSVVMAVVSGLVLTACAEDTDVEAEGEEAQVAAPADTVSPDVELDELRQEYERAYSERDTPALAALHTKDYLEISPEGEVTTRTQLDSLMRDTTAMQGGDLSIETESMVVAESGDVAYGTGTTTLRGTGPDGREFTAESRWLAGFKKVGGAWKIDRLMTSTPAAAEMTAPAGGRADTTRTTTADTTATTM